MEGDGRGLLISQVKICPGTQGLPFKDEKGILSMWARPDLRQRVSSYFQRASHAPRANIVGKIATFTYVVTDSEEEASCSNPTLSGIFPTLQRSV